MADVGDAAPSPPPAPTLPEGELGVLVLSASHRVTAQPDELTVVVLSLGHHVAILTP